MLPIFICAIAFLFHVPALPVQMWAYTQADRLGVEATISEFAGMLSQAELLLKRRIGTNRRSWRENNVENAGRSGTVMEADNDNAARFEIHFGKGRQV